MHGFWRAGFTTVFDIRVTDPECDSFRTMETDKLLARHEKEKKKKYAEACQERRRDFTPLVFTVDGCGGVETNAAIKRLAALLAIKWRREYSEVCGYVKSRLSIALVRSASTCLRGSRDPTARAWTSPVTSGSALTTY